MQALVAKLMDLLSLLAAKDSPNGDILSANSVQKRAFDPPFDKTGILSLVATDIPNATYSWHLGHGFGPPWETTGALVPLHPGSPGSRELQLFGRTPGNWAVSCKATVPGGTSESGFARLSVPWFVWIHEDQASQSRLDAALAVVGLQPFRDQYITMVKTYAEGILSRIVNVRMIWQIPPFSDQLPAQLDPSLGSTHGSPGLIEGKLGALDAAGPQWFADVAAADGDLGLSNTLERRFEVSCALRASDSTDGSEGLIYWVGALKSLAMSGTLSPEQQNLYVEGHARHDAIILCHEVLHCMNIGHRNDYTPIIRNNYPEDKDRPFRRDLMNVGAMAKQFDGFLTMRVRPDGSRARLWPLLPEFEDPALIGQAAPRYVHPLPDTSDEIWVFDLFDLHGYDALASAVTPWNLEFLLGRAPLPGNTGRVFR